MRRAEKNIIWLEMLTVGHSCVVYLGCCSMLKIQPPSDREAFIIQDVDKLVDMGFSRAMAQETVNEVMELIEQVKMICKPQNADDPTTKECLKQSLLLSGLYNMFADRVVEAVIMLRMTAIVAQAEAEPITPEKGI
jgi:hypothetical protein